MTPTQIACVVLLCTSALGWGCAFKYKGDLAAEGGNTKVAQNNEATARQGATDASKHADTAIDLALACSGERERVRQENEGAIEQARLDGIKEGQRTEKFLQDLENAGDECAPITQAQVCDQLYPY